MKEFSFFKKEKFRRVILQKLLSNLEVKQQLQLKNKKH